MRVLYGEDFESEVNMDTNRAGGGNVGPTFGSLELPLNSGSPLLVHEHLGDSVGFSQCIVKFFRLANTILLGTVQEVVRVFLLILCKATHSIRTH